MSKILITGATGNVGKAILSHLNYDTDEITAGVRNIERAQKSLSGYRCSFIEFDFESATGFDRIHDYDILFLLRPPHIGDVKRYLFSLLKETKEGNTAIVFLSVQGADKKDFIPHAKVESEIRRLDIPHFFLRPSYFLDNLTSTLTEELKLNKRIYLPSSNLTFNWISVDSIGKVGAKVLGEFDIHKGKALELTSPQNLGFKDIIEKINERFGTVLSYRSANLFRFVSYRKKHGDSWGYIGVLLLLHFLPRFEPAPRISNDYQTLMGVFPESVEEFLERNREWFETL